MNPYEILGVPTDSSDDYIKAKFRILAQQLHPDKQGGDEERFKLVKLAYEILSDPERRKLFDTTGQYDLNPSVRSEALQKVLEILAHTLANFTPETDDLILCIKVEINQLRATEIRNKEVCIQFINKLNKALPKIKLKDGKNENVLFHFTQQQIINRQKELVEFNRRLEICDVMEEILNNYHYGDQDWMLFVEANLTPPQ